MSLDFALKDFYRKRKSNFPYILTITLVIAITEFIVYFSTSLGLNLIYRTTIFSNSNIDNEYYFSGAINRVYTQFNTLILIMVCVLSFLIVVIITTTIIIHKRRDIAIMKALGTLPGKLYRFYLLESYIVFLLGFIFGLILGLGAFGIFALIMGILRYKLFFQVDLIYTPILFISCIVGIFIINGFSLRRIGNQKIVSSFSQDIPYSFNASKKLTIIPRWLSSLGFNLKIAITNTVRRRNEYIRFMLVFTTIFLIIFTLGLGAFVLNTSSQRWIENSQGENIIVIGHEDVVDNYVEMYAMFSDPSASVDEDDVNFLKSEYLFNRNNTIEIEAIDEVKEVEERLITFSDVEELDGYYYFTDEEGTGGYRIVGQQREGNFPIVGVNPDDILQDFEIEGDWFDEDDEHDNMTIGDGLAYNFFDYPLDQSMRVKDLSHRFHVSGVVIDSFYGGYAGYISINIFREELNYTNGEINILLLEIDDDSYKDIKNDLKEIIKDNLGSDFTFYYLDRIFKKNLDYLSNLTLYPIILIIIMGIVAVLSLYNYQKAGLVEKAKDFLIMRALGTKRKSIKRILFFESLFVIVPSILLSLSIGMILNTTILLERAYLPPLYVPFIGIGILFVLMTVFNSLSLIPIIKKIDQFNIRDMKMY
ncbi:MAG: FtsX-like permease family protein [Candidatus Hermodarchaeota archaeon]